jgi:hypothetical protein
VNRLTRTGWVAVLGVLLVGGTLTYGLVHLLARGHQEPSVVQAPQAPKLAPTPVSPQPVAPSDVAAAPAPGTAAGGFVPTLAWALSGEPAELALRLGTVTRYWGIRGVLECPDRDPHHCRIRE